MNSILKGETPVLKDSCIAESKKFPSELLSSEKLLELTVSHLESEKDSLLTTVADLRQLIKRIATQQETEASRKRLIQQDFLKKIQALESALKTSQKHSPHLSTICDFWKDFIN